jgi:hypothetical protein
MAAHPYQQRSAPPLESGSRKGAERIFARRMRMKFKIGNMVEWMSQSHGSWVAKMGMIVAIVPAYKRVGDHTPDVFTSPFSSGCPRDHESYLVQVGNRKLLYWPRVSVLKLVKILKVKS